MAPIDFIPKHNQPFTLEQAMLLEIDILVAEISRLNNSIAHLERTQAELLEFIRDDPDGDEDGEIGKAKEENDQVIQRERITLIKIALMNKIGEGGIKHYGLDTKTSPVTSAANLAARAPSETPAAGAMAAPARELPGTRNDPAPRPPVNVSSVANTDDTAPDADSGLYL